MKHSPKKAAPVPKTRPSAEKEKTAPFSDTPPAATADIVAVRPIVITDATKDLAYFSREISKTALAFWRSTKYLADILVEARITLPKEEFQQLIAEAQLDYSFVCKAVKQGESYRLNDPLNQDCLPEAFATRHEIMLMHESTFRTGLSKGIINKDCKLADVQKLREKAEGRKKRKKPHGKNQSSPVPQTAVPVELGPGGMNSGVRSNGETVMISEQSEERGVPQTTNNPALRQIEATATAETAEVPIAAKAGRMLVLLSQESAERNRDDIELLKDRLEKLLVSFRFIESVEFEVVP